MKLLVFFSADNSFRHILIELRIQVRVSFDLACQKTDLIVQPLHMELFIRKIVSGFKDFLRMSKVSHLHLYLMQDDIIQLFGIDQMRRAAQPVFVSSTMIIEILLSSFHRASADHVLPAVSAFHQT